MSAPPAAAPAHLADLSEAQRRAAERLEGPVRIIAGAGSGKTRTVTVRIAEQIRRGVADASQVLAVTFTERAGAELRDRLRRMGLHQPVRATTFHAAAFAQLRWFLPRLGYGDPPGVLERKGRLLAEPARAAGLDPADLAAEIEWAKARRLTPERYPGALAGRRCPADPARVAEAFAAYERAKDREGMIDFDDMVLRCTELLTEHAEVAEQVRDRYRFLTVDEMQDVNPAQEALLDAWLGGSDQICVVGDPDQTIFGFAGASPTMLEGFARRFPHATTVELRETHRCTRQVARAANLVIAAGRSGRRRLVSVAGDGPVPEVRALVDDAAERREVVDVVGEELAAGTAPGEIAVAVRTNAQAEPIEQALRDAGVPAVTVGGPSFFDRPEVRQALATLADEAARPRPEAHPYPEGSQPAGPTAPREAARALRARMGVNPDRPPVGRRSLERWRSLTGLLEAVGRLAAEDPALDLAGAVRALRARAGAGALSPGPDGAVQLLTLHRAKGLEFDCVVIPGCEEGLLPLALAEQDGGVDEERRLLYVGMTRARRRLVLTWAARRVGADGRARARRCSRLLRPLRQDRAAARLVDRT